MIKNSKAFALKGRLYLDMLLQEGLVPSHMSMKLVLLHIWSAFHLMDYGRKPECQDCIREPIPEVDKVKVDPSKNPCLEKVLGTLGANYPQAHMVIHHFTIATGDSTVGVDAAFRGQIPTKVSIIWRAKVAFSGLAKNPIHFAHMFLNSACLVVNGSMLVAQALQPDFEQGT